MRTAVSTLVTQLALSSSRLCRLQISLDSNRLGSLGFSRTGPLGFTEVWEDGPVLRDLGVRLAALGRAREEVEAARKVGARGMCVGLFRRVCLWHVCGSHMHVCFGGE